MCDYDNVVMRSYADKDQHTLEGVRGERFIPHSFFVGKPKTNLKTRILSYIL